MPDAEHKKDEAHAPAKKKGKGLLIIIVAVALAGLGAGGFLVFKSKSGPAQAHGQEAQETHGPSGEEAPGEAKHGSTGTGSIFSLEPFIVNLLDNSGTRYLKLTINLELNPNSNTGELTSQSAQIRDSLIILLSSKSYAEIGTVEGKYQMRDEIVARVNQFLAKSKVKTAYFTDFVIQ